MIAPTRLRAPFLAPTRLRAPLLAALALAAALAPAAAAPPPPRDRALDQCKAEIGWSRMTAAQQASPSVQFQLALCLKRRQIR